MSVDLTFYTNKKVTLSKIRRDLLTTIFELNFRNEQTYNDKISRELKKKEFK